MRPVILLLFAISFQNVIATEASFSLPILESQFQITYTDGWQWTDICRSSTKPCMRGRWSDGKKISGVSYVTSLRLKEPKTQKIEKLCRDSFQSMKTQKNTRVDDFQFFPQEKLAYCSWRSGKDRQFFMRMGTILLSFSFESLGDNALQEKIFFESVEKTMKSVRYE